MGMQSKPPARPGHRSRAWYAVMAVAAFAVLCVLAMLASGGWLSPIARREMIRALKQQYQSDLEIRSLRISFIPYPHATGDGFVFRKNGRTDVPPLMVLGHIEAEAGWFDLLRSPRIVRKVRLEGFQIHVSRDSGGKDQDQHAPAGGRNAGKTYFVIQELIADGTLLQVIPKAPGKPPLTFDIYRLTLNSAGLHRPMRYRAQLRNAKPPGLIQATGDFGPWNAADPAQTPVAGTYRFSDADLGVFKGLSGKLSSSGEFHGPLDRIEVSGRTDTPDFMVSAGGHRIHLKTTFSATVDGTDGDTLLHPVTAQFRRTTVVAQGGVTGAPGVPGKTVSLDAVVRDGDLADLLRLGVKSEPPPMTGRISFHSKIQIPPGDRDIALKLRLNGGFDIESGKFTSPVLENKVTSLSRRARGDTEGADQSEAVSNVRGRFVLDGGILTLSGLTFHVPGATIRLNGTYGLLTESLDFRGTATMEAKLSEMTTGFKSFLLKALDPIFHKNKAGAVIPIHISGTREHPSVGLNFKP